jgi:hypothetical protein
MDIGLEEGKSFLPEYWGSEGKIIVEIEETDDMKREQEEEPKKR